MKIYIILSLACFLSACGVSSSEYDRVVSERDSLANIVYNLTGGSKKQPLQPTQASIWKIKEYPITSKNRQPNMKKIIYSFILILMSLSLFSQKLASNKIDEFDNVRKMATSDKKITGNPLAVIQFETVDNVVFMKWGSRYVALFTARGKKLYLLDDEGKKYTFYCIAASNYNNIYSSLRYIGDFNTIENKRIIKYRIETIDGVVDYNVDKSKTEVIAQQYRFIKSEVEKYFPNGVLNVKETMDVLNSKVEMKDILDALNGLSE